jgi:SAM-dependent methyltransferase
MPPEPTAVPRTGDGYYRVKKAAGAFGGVAHLDKFARYVAPRFRVAEFGCAGGWLLRNLDCAERIAVESNAALASEARLNGVTVFASIDEIAPGSIDLFISDNAFEHVDEPLAVLCGVHRALRRGGRAVFVVACETILVGYSDDDPNQHLFSWSPGALGNLFKRAGFRVIESKPYIHRWPPGSKPLRRLVGWKLWHALARLYGCLYLPVMQVRLVAEKP